SACRRTWPKARPVMRSLKHMKETSDTQKTIEQELEVFDQDVLEEFKDNYGDKIKQFVQNRDRRRCRSYRRRPPSVKPRRSSTGFRTTVLRLQSILRQH
ncbi:MAG: hypothetical protein AB2810_17030, partial [Candidatus Thiodiazotropha endolucinida]